eukprot:scaffold142236_cov36-Tisochrysis_lutea.AAC.1
MASEGYARPCVGGRPFGFRPHPSVSIYATVDETTQAIRSIGPGKSAGPDGIPAEVYKAHENIVSSTDTNRALQSVASHGLTHHPAAVQHRVARHCATSEMQCGKSRGRPHPEAHPNHTIA